MGFTWESDCHLFYRRANALRLAIGSRSGWQDRLIERLQGLGHDAAAMEEST